MGMWVNQTDGGQFLVNCVTNGVGHGFSGLMGGVMVGYYRFGCGHRVNHRFDHTLQNLVANGGVNLQFMAFLCVPCLVMIVKTHSIFIDFLSVYSGLRIKQYTVCVPFLQYCTSVLVG
jgi:hypothetical protein